MIQFNKVYFRFRTEDNKRLSTLEVSTKWKKCPRPLGLLMDVVHASSAFIEA